MEKGRIPGSALADLLGATLDEAAVLRCVALDERIAMKMMEVPREAVPDLPDRVNCSDGVAARRAYPKAGTVELRKRGSKRSGSEAAAGAFSRHKLAVEVLRRFRAKARFIRERIGHRNHFGSFTLRPLISR